MVSLVHLTISFLPWMVSEDAWMMVGHLGKSGGDLILIPELLNWLWAICSTLTKIEVPLLAKGLGHEVVGRTHYTITINVLNGSMVKKIRCSTNLFGLAAIRWEDVHLPKPTNFVSVFGGFRSQKKRKLSSCSALELRTISTNEICTIRKCAEICLECYLSS